MYRWATTGDETLRTYATGILASAAEQQDINSHYTSDNNALVLRCFALIVLIFLETMVVTVI